MDWENIGFRMFGAFSIQDCTLQFFTKMMSFKAEMLIQLCHKSMTSSGPMERVGLSNLNWKMSNLNSE